MNSTCILVLSRGVFVVFYSLIVSVYTDHSQLISRVPVPHDGSLKLMVQMCFHLTLRHICRVDRRPITKGPYRKKYEKKIKVTKVLQNGIHTENMYTVNVSKSKNF